MPQDSKAVHEPPTQGAEGAAGVTDDAGSRTVDLQAILRTTAQAITTDMAAEYTHGNAMSLTQLQNDPNIEIRPFPDEVLRLLRSIAREVAEELMANDPASAKVGKAYFDFLDKAAENSRLSEKAYLNARDV